MWWCFLPVAAEVGDVDPLTIEVRLINEVVLQYFLYRVLDLVDLEGALVSLFHQLLGEGELLRSTWLLGSPVR